MDNVQALQAGSGTTVVIRSITSSAAKVNTIIVAGTFAKAGSLECVSICSFDTSAHQCNSLGNGINGEVAAVAYAGSNPDILVASGSITLSDNTGANVASYRTQSGGHVQQYFKFGVRQILQATDLNSATKGDIQAHIQAQLERHRYFIASVHFIHLPSLVLRLIRAQALTTLFLLFRIPSNPMPHVLETIGWYRPGSCSAGHCSPGCPRRSSSMSSRYG